MIPGCQSEGRFIMQFVEPEIPIYLDYAATSPVDDRVLRAMLPFFGRTFGNAASIHGFGRMAAEAVERARTQLASLLRCAPEDVIWTSGATEANNLALEGAVRASGKAIAHLITQATEHKAVLDPVLRLHGEGVETTVLPVDAEGLVDPADVRSALRTETVLVSVMTANNEVGTLQPVNEIAAICQEADVAFHTDASQAVGKITIDMEGDQIDLLSVSGHKLYGPKGIGALIFRRSPKLRKLIPLIDGGGHERGLRSGTLNVPAIVGLGTACEIAAATLEEERDRLERLRDGFEKALMDSLPDVLVNAAGSPRLPTITNIAFLGVDAESLLLSMGDVAASTGLACTAASLEPSHVLRAMRLPPERQMSSVRFSLGRPTSQVDILHAVASIVRNVTILRQLSCVSDPP